MESNSKKRFTAVFDKVKDKYSSESKERLKERQINQIKKDNDKGCGCKG